MGYTFGDSDEASRRLERLAALYEPETRALLTRARALLGEEPVALAVDLGCGPGWTTALVQEILRPRRTVGLELSERFLAEARARHAACEFVQQDLLQPPYAVAGAEVLFCRFLLTHLDDPGSALRSWRQMAAPRALLLLHETEWLKSEDAAISRYYAMVAQMQRHYGQELNVGALLDECVLASGWELVESRCVELEKPAAAMAALHMPNLRTWSKNAYAMEAFDRAEVAELEAELEAIATGQKPAAPVRNAARQVVARHCMQQPRCAPPAAFS